MVEVPGYGCVSGRELQKSKQGRQRTHVLLSIRLSQLGILRRAEVRGVLDYHDPPTPETCDVCSYVRDHPEVDLRLEHTMTQIATAYLIEDLEDVAGGPLRLSEVAVSSIGHPGPQQPIEPRHWFWALMTERGLLISLDFGGGQ